MVRLILIKPFLYDKYRDKFITPFIYHTRDESNKLAVQFNAQNI